MNKMQPTLALYLHITTHALVSYIRPRIYHFCKTRVRIQNAIFVIPSNNVVRIEDTALSEVLLCMGDG